MKIINKRKANLNTKLSVYNGINTVLPQIVLISLIALSGIFSNSSVKLAEVPSSVRHYIAAEDGYGASISNFNPNAERVDYNINYERLEKETAMSIDLSIENDLSFIKKMPNLRIMTIYSAERLTPEQLYLLNNINLFQINLNFNNIYINKEQKFDVSLLNKINDINIYYCPREDLDVITFEEYIINKGNADIQYYGGHYVSSEVDLMNDELDKIVKSLDISNDDSEEEKIIKISNYVLDKIEYDSIVADNLDSIAADKLSDYYNDHDLYSILSKDGNDIEGVCVNYANLFDILCYKNGIKCRTVSGEDSIGRHRWNIVYLNDGNNRYYIDLTSIDFEYINSKIDEYLLSDSKYDKEQLFNDIKVFLYQKLSTHETFKLDTEIEELDKESKVINIYYNEGLDGKMYIADSSRNHINNAIVVLLCSVIINSFTLIRYNSLKKQAKNLEEIKKRKNIFNESKHF